MKRSVYAQVDEDIVKTYLFEHYKKLGIKVMDIEEAKRRGIAKKYLWKALKERYETKHGYFIYIPENTVVKTPIMTCLIIREDNVEQRVHNIVVLGRNSEATLAVGCYGAAESLHLGVSEFFIGKNAKLNYVMIHSWNEEMRVYPKTGVIVEEGGKYFSYYINTRKVKELVTFPKVYLKENAYAEQVSIVYATENSSFDVGGGIFFEGKDSKGEILSRIVVEKGKVINRALLSAKKRARGHIDCKGLILEEGFFQTIPELISETGDAILTHEAAVGKISEEELIYLMMKGFDEEQAESLIIKGFVSEGLEKIPEPARREVKKVINALVKRRLSL